MALETNGNVDALRELNGVTGVRRAATIDAAGGYELDVSALLPARFDRVWFRYIADSEGGPGVIPVRYQVLRSVGTGSTPFFVVGVRAFHERAHQDSTVGSGAAYKYKVAAINGSGSVESGPQNVTTPAGSRPARPYDMAAVWSSPSVTVSWYDRATNETGFEVERSDNGRAFALIGTRGARSGAGATSYTERGGV